MTHSISFLRTSFLSIPLLAGAMLATGCLDEAEPTTSTDTQDLVTQAGASPVAALAELRVAGGSTSMASPGWTQTAPGVWASSSKSGTGSIVVGAEGHRIAIAKGKTELAALRANGGSAQAIAQLEAYLGNLEAGAQRIATQPAVPQAVSCNIGFVVAPSSLVFPGFVGVFAGAELSCTGGTQVFTVQAQACTDFGCGPVATFFPTIGAVPQLFGTARSGTPGFLCFGQAFVSPPGLVGSANVPCG
jgi:hypothetical protein